MKKLFALLLAIVLMLGVCAAATAEEPVTITFWHTYGDAETPVIDDVIIPKNTRFRVIRALEALANKKQLNPARKHGNIPL